MDFVSNLIELGSFIIGGLLFVGSLIIFVLVGFLIGDEKGHSAIGFFGAMLIWAWITVSLITSSEFIAWVSR